MTETLSDRAEIWASCYWACVSPESRLGALRGAKREKCLADVLRKLGIRTPDELVENLNKES